MSLAAIPTNDLMELQATIAKNNSDIKNRNKLIAALNQELNERTLLVYLNDAEYKLVNELIDLPLKVLDAWLSDMLAKQIAVPRVLWEVVEQKRNDESMLYLSNALNDYKANKGFTFANDKY